MATSSVAYLVTKEYIVVTEPIITYTGDTHEPYSGRGNPLRQVEVKTVTTPPIDFDPSTDPGIKGRHARLGHRLRALGAQRRSRRPVLVCRHGPRGAYGRLHHQRYLGRPDLHRPSRRRRHHRRLRHGRAEPQLPVLRRPALRFRRHRRRRAWGHRPARRQLHPDGDVRCQRRRQLLPPARLRRGPPARGRTDRGRRVDAPVGAERVDLRQLPEQRFPDRGDRGLPGREENGPVAQFPRQPGGRDGGPQLQRQWPGPGSRTGRRPPGQPLGRHVRPVRLFQQPFRHGGQAPRGHIDHRHNQDRRPGRSGVQRPGPPDFEQLRLPPRRRHPAPDGDRHQAQLEPDGASGLVGLFPTQRPRHDHQPVGDGRYLHADLEPGPDHLCGPRRAHQFRARALR